MKQSIASLALFLILPLLFFFVMEDFSALFEKSDASLVMKEEKPPITLAEPPALSLSAKHAVLMTDQGHIVYGKNEHVPTEMASTTKVMTGYLAAEYLEKHGLKAKTVVQKSAVGIEGSSVYLEEGEEVAIVDLLYAVMLASANDAAVALAEAIGGTSENFVAMMNATADEMCLAGTHFENPHGLSAEGHTTTAYSLALLMARAMENTLFARVTATGQYTMKSNVATRYLVNHNRLLNAYDGIVGGKTGFTKRAGRCLVSAAERDGARFYAVTLSAPDDWNDHKTLYDHAFSSWEAIKIPAFRLTLPTVSGKESHATVTSREIMLTLPKNRGEIAILREAPRFLYAPVAEGDVVGNVTVTLSGRPIATVDLYNEKTVSADYEKSFFEKLLSWIRKG